MSDEYSTIKRYSSGSRNANRRMNDPYTFINRTWPTDTRPSTQTEQTRADAAGTNSTMQRWADEGMTEQPYNTVGSFRSPDDEQSNTEGTGNKPDTKQEDAGGCRIRGEYKGCMRF